MKKATKFFEEAWEEYESNVDGDGLSKDDAKHFFEKGRACMAEEFWYSKPKRTISNLIKLDGQIYVISNDGKLFINHYTKPEEWRAFPDLPQDATEVDFGVKDLKF